MRSKFYLLIITIFFSCKDSDRRTPPSESMRIAKVPSFNADSAHFFIKKQVDFGPRIPNTKAHRQAGDYFTAAFKKYGAHVSTQEFDSYTFDGQTVRLKNIIASYYLDKQKRIYWLLTGIRVPLLTKTSKIQMQNLMEPMMVAVALVFC